MTYDEFQNTIQQYLESKKQSGQKIGSETVARFQAPYKLSLVRSVGRKWVYHELHAEIQLENFVYDAAIGTITDKGREVQARLYGIKKYGGEEFTRAVRMVAIDSLHKKLRKKTEIYKEKRSEADSIHEELNKTAFSRAELSLSLMSQEEIDMLMKEFSTDEERRAAQKVIEEQMIRNAPKEPVIVHPSADAEFGLTSGRCSRKSWIRFTKDQE